VYGYEFVNSDMTDISKRRLSTGAIMEYTDINKSGMKKLETEWRNFRNSDGKEISATNPYKLKWSEKIKKKK